MDKQANTQEHTLYTTLILGYRDMVLQAYEYADCIDASIEEEMRRLDAIARSLHIDIQGEARKREGEAQWISLRI